VFSRNAMTGALTYVEVKKDGVGGIDGLAGASGVAVSGDGAHVYVTGSLDNSVAVFSRNAGTGALTYIEFFQDGIGGTDGLRGASAVAISADGNNVYVAGKTDNGIAAFTRNPSTGHLTFLAAHKDGVGGVDGLAGASAIASSPDGVHVYVTGA